MASMFDAELDKVTAAYEEDPNFRGIVGKIFEPVWTQYVNGTEMEDLGVFLSEDTVIDDEAVEQIKTFLQTGYGVDTSMLDDMSPAEISAAMDAVQTMVQDFDEQGLRTMDVMSTEAPEAEESSDGVQISGKDIDVDYMARSNDTTTDLIEQYASLSVSEREITPRFKSQLEGATQGTGADGKTRWDEPESMEDPIVLNEGLPTECKITETVNQNYETRYYCESEYLGNFYYDPEEWAIGYKEIPGTESENPDGSLTKVPVLKYIGDLESDWMHSPYGLSRGAQVTIPDGVKNLDYTFEDNGELQLIPAIPDTVTSMHCTFKNCTELHGASRDFKIGEGLLNGGGQWNLPEGLEDLSGAFSGCHELGSTWIGKLPKFLKDITAAFEGCSDLNPKEQADWSDCPYLREECANAIDSSTSDKFKANAEKESKELAKAEKNRDIENEPEDVKREHEDANAANAVKKTERVLDGTTDVRDINEMSLNLKENEFGALLQRGVIDLASFAVIKGATKMVTGSGLVGAVAGLAGTWLLDKTDILPESIEPALEYIKGYLPEGGQKAIDSILDVIGTGNNMEELEAARKERYNSVALTDSFTRPVTSFGVVDSEELIERMNTNAKVVAEAGVFERVAADPENEVQTVREVMTDAVSSGSTAMEEMYANGELTEDELKQKMNEYYMGLLTGLESYNEGAVDGFPMDCDLAASYQGLADINKAYAEPVMESLVAMDEKYHFLAEEDKQKLGALEIVGIDGLEQYQVTDAAIDVPEDDVVAEDAQTSTGYASQQSRELLKSGQSVEGQYASPKADAADHDKKVAQAEEQLRVNQQDTEFDDAQLE